MADTVDTSTWTGSCKPPSSSNSAPPYNGTTPFISEDIYNATKYKMNCSYRGKAIIIDNNKFHPSTGLADRFGTNKDLSALEKALQSVGRFDVQILPNLCRNDMEKQLENVAQSDFSDYGCFICVISSHGDEGRIWAVDEIIELDDLFKRLHASNAKSLIGKPKIFIIQACRGTDMDHGAEIDVIIDTSGQCAEIQCESTERDGSSGTRQTQNATSAPLATSGQTVTLPNDADFLVMFSSVEGKYAVRNTDKGSWYLQAVADALTSMEQGEDFLSVLTRANATVAHDKTYDGQPVAMKGMKQMPCFRSMLTKTLIMKP